MHVDRARLDMDVRPQTASSSSSRENTRRGCCMKNSSRRNSVGPRCTRRSLRVTRCDDRSIAMSWNASWPFDRHGVGAAQQRAHPGQQRLDVERLGDVVVGAGVQAAHRVLVLGPRGHHDHRQVAGRRPCGGSGGRPRCRTSPAASSPAARGPAASRRCGSAPPGRRRPPRRGSPASPGCSAASSRAPPRPRPPGRAASAGWTRPSSMTAHLPALVIAPYSGANDGIGGGVALRPRIRNAPRPRRRSRRFRRCWWRGRRSAPGSWR